jgi:hypothetical protein
MNLNFQDVLLAFVQFALPALITGVFGYLIATRRKRK